MITKVTITGADDSTDLAELAAILRLIPDDEENHQVRAEIIMIQRAATNQTGEENKAAGTGASTEPPK